VRIIIMIIIMMLLMIKNYKVLHKNTTLEDDEINHLSKIGEK